MNTTAITGTIPIVSAAVASTDAPSSAAAIAASTPATGSTDAADSTAGFNQLANTQTFLQLLVAQLKNQDPTNPADPTQFMTEIAQMTAVQSQTSLDGEEQTVAADSMIGKTVTGITATGATASGIVNTVLLSSSGSPQLEIGSGTSLQVLPLTSISQISATYGSDSPTAT